MKRTVAIFDMDGTLVDSMYQWGRIAANVLFEFGYQMTDEDAREVKRLGFYRCPSYLIDKYALPCNDKQFIDRGYAIMLEQYRSFVMMRPGAKEYLIGLKQKGVRVAVLTASAGCFVEVMIRKFGLEGFIDASFSAHDLEMEKSKPAIYEMLFEHFACKGEDCVMFEDSAYALKVAKTLGVFGVGIADPAQPTRREKLLAAADYFADTYEELAAAPLF